MAKRLIPVCSPISSLKPRRQALMALSLLFFLIHSFVQGLICITEPASELNGVPFLFACVRMGGGQSSGDSFNVSVIEPHT